MAERGSANGNGITRRAFVRRTAVVGGSLLWIAPAIQTLAPAARAHAVGTPTHQCCSCRKVSGLGADPCNQCATDATPTLADCEAYCAQFSTPDVTCGVKEFHSGTTAFTCTGGAECQPKEHV
ncbi:MAG TPA: hypothetical protein VNP94_08260 [Actinomycetota bacterium]|nr:hypothetical protein [Actinomycetota bacterium]